MTTRRVIDYTNISSGLQSSGKKAALHNGVDIRVLRNGTREPGQGRNTAALSGQSHVP